MGGCGGPFFSSSHRVIAGIYSSCLCYQTHVSFKSAITLCSDVQSLSAHKSKFEAILNMKKKCLCFKRSGVSTIMSLES